MALTPVSPLRAGGRDSGALLTHAGVQWMNHDIIQCPHYAICLGTNPGRGYSQKVLFPRSATCLFSSGRKEPLGMAA